MLYRHHACGEIAQIARSDALGEVLHLLYEGAQVTAAIQQDVRPFTTARTSSQQLLRSQA